MILVSESRAVPLGPADYLENFVFADNAPTPT